MGKTFLFGAFALVFAQAIFVLSGYVVHIGLGRLLGPAGYGLYGVAISLVMLASLIFNSGLKVAVSKFVSANPSFGESIKSAALRLNFKIGLVLSIAYFLLAGLFSVLLNDARLASLIQVSSLIILGYAFYTVFLGFLNGMKQYNRQALLISAYSIAKAVLILVLVLLASSVAGALFGFALSLFVGAMMGLVLSGFAYSNKAFSQLKILRFALPVLVFVFFTEFSLTLGLFAAKSLLIGETLAGYYNAALQLSRLPYYFTIALSSALLPFVSHSFSKNEKQKLRHSVRKALKYFLCFVVPSSLLISLFSSPLVEILFGSDFLPSSSPLAILAFASIFFCFFYLLSIVLIGIEKQKLATLVSLTVFSLALALNFILIPIFSLSGSAFATLIAFFFGSVFTGLAVWKHLPR